MRKNIDVTGINTNYTSNIDVIEPYLREIRHYPVLSLEEEQNLIKDYKTTRNPASRDKLIKCNMRFVFAIAKRYTRNPNVLLDLYNQGNIGLCTAIERFDPDKDIRFLSYAVWYIRCEMGAFFNENLFVKKTNWQRNTSRLNKIKNTFFLHNGRYPTDEELFELFNAESPIKLTSKSSVYDLESISLSSSLDNNDSPYEDSPAFNEKTAFYNDFEKKIEDEETHYIIDNALKLLTEREKEIIKMSFKIGYDETYNLDTIAEIMGLSRERVRQIRKSALNKMRKGLTNKKLKCSKTA